MPHFAKCDVISGENKKFKLKYLINKTLEHGGIKKCFSVYIVPGRSKTPCFTAY